MIAELHMYAVLPAADLQRARQFYKDKLGLEPSQQTPDGLVYDTPGGTLVVYETPNAGSAKNTAMGWRADDLEGTVQDLRDKGVTFEEYDMPGLKTVNGIADSGDERAAWFKDSEGNILCVSQSAK